MAYTGLGLLLMLLSRMLNIITADLVDHACSTGPSRVNYTTNNSRFLTNLDLLLSSLSSNATSRTGGYYNATIVNGSDEVYGAFLCRGDITTTDCQTCVDTGRKDIKPLCPNMTAAIVWYDNCMIRYSNQSFSSILQQDPVFYPYGPKNITNLDQYNKTVDELLHRLVEQAVLSSSTPKYYAADEVKYYTGNDTVYGLVQCTHDITPDECKICLNGGIDLDIGRILYPREGGRILKPSCNLRYEFNSAFYQQASSSPPATSPPSATSSPATSPSTNSSGIDGKGRNSTLIFILIALIVASI